MTLTLRNTILRASLASIVVTSVAVAASLVRITDRLPTPDELGVQQFQRWLVFRWGGGFESLEWIVGGLFVVAGFSVVGAAVIIRYFRKTTAPEMLFFVMFVLAIGVDVWKIGHVILYLEQLPVQFSVTLTRVVQFAHLFGVLCLFISTLYLTGVDYQKTGTMLGVVALIALAVVYAIPVDQLTLYPNLLHKVGNESTNQAVILVLQCLSLANIAYSVFYQRNEEYLVLLPAILAAVVGRELVFYMPSLWGTIIGFCLLAGGAAVFGSRMHTIYLWR